MPEKRTGSRSLGFVPDLQEATVRRILVVLVGLVGLLFVLGLVAVLPAVDRVLAALDLPLGAVLVAVATLLVVGALVLVAPTTRSALAQALDGPEEVVANAAASAMYLVYFAAVVVAYRGFDAVVTPLFGAFDLQGVYHLAFLLVGLVVLAALVRRLYRCWGPVTDLLTGYVTGALGGARPADPAEE